MKRLDRKGSIGAISHILRMLRTSLAVQYSIRTSDRRLALDLLVAVAYLTHYLIAERGYKNRFTVLMCG
ncbi:MAG: hypothetical protein C5S38_05125 [Candidatus Methanophagaceae archaeon]|nr:MAG: hypothetical protein C5S38_05125 [Methanophagales archaeon]